MNPELQPSFKKFYPLSQTEKKEVGQGKRPDIVDAATNFLTLLYQNITNLNPMELIAHASDQMSQLENEKCRMEKIQLARATSTGDIDAIRVQLALNPDIEIEKIKEMTDADVLHHCRQALESDLIELASDTADINIDLRLETNPDYQDNY